MTHQVSMDNCSHFCCGVTELGNFQEGSDIPSWSDNIITGKTWKSAWTKSLKNCIENISKGVIIQIWFARLKKFDGSLQEEYDCSELRDIVRDMVGVTHLATTINPNTGNEIDGYMWVNTGKLEFKPKVTTQEAIPA